MVVGKSILLYKVVSFFLSVAKDLSYRRSDMVLLYSGASYRSWDGFRLFFFNIPLNIEPLDARGAATSIKILYL